MVDLFTLIASFVLSILFIPIAIQDWKDCSIKEYWFWVFWVACWLAWYFCRRPWIPGIVMAILCLFLIVPKEFKIFGDADFLMIGAYLAVYSHFGFLSFVPFIFPIILLLMMVPYAKYYCKVHGTKWKFMAGVFVPVLPLAAVSWWITTLCYVVYLLVGR